MADEGREAAEIFKLGIGIIDRLGGRGAGTRELLGVSRPDMEKELDAENVGEKAR
jgi:hypothetical protein